MGKYFKLENKMRPWTFVFFVLGIVSSHAVFAAVSETAVTATMEFNSSTIGIGSTSTLTYAITNPNNYTVDNIAFNNSLPTGIEVASVPFASSDCNGTLTAVGGGSSIALNGGQLAALGSCSISVNVIGNAFSVEVPHTNTVDDLSSDEGASPVFTADLDVSADRVGFSKSFSPNPITPGGRSTLTFVLDNINGGAEDSLTFSDVLPEGMSIAFPSNAATTCTGGNSPPVLTALSGTANISLIRGFVAGEDTCEVVVDVIGTTIGFLDNISSELTVAGNNPSGKASASLEVAVTSLSLVKSFTTNPVPAGGTVDLMFTISNYTRSDAATGITFEDDLDETLAGLTATGLPMSACGGTLSGTSVLSFSGGSAAADSSCSFSVPLTIPADSVTGSYTNTTSAITATMAGDLAAGNQAIDTLFVQPGPLLSKTFLNNPIDSGETTTLEFTISNSSTTSTATEISFEDAMLSGAEITALPATGFCGAGSIASQTVVLDIHRLVISGASLAASDSCTFTIDILMPENAAGEFINVTTPVTAMVDDLLASGFPATDTLNIVRAPKLTKEFTDDPINPGDTVTLEFTLSHDLLAAGDATGIAFNDDLGVTLGGLTATGLPISACGGTMSGTSLLSFSGGSLTPGESCTFSLTLQVPDPAAIGPHTNTTSTVSANISGISATSAAAVDELVVAGLSIVKSFSKAPVIPGDTVDLQFTISNDSNVSGATAIAFRDDLNAVFSGLVVSGALPATPCGTGSSIIDVGNVLTFTGGELLSGASCTFSVALLIPPGTSANTYINTTSELRATIDGNNYFFDNARANLSVSADRLSLTKTFADENAIAGSSVNVDFSLTNLDSSTATDIAFTDDLNAALSGLVTTGTLPANPCGSSSALTGGTMLSLTGGELAGGASCTFTVSLLIPDPAALGAFTNITSSVTGDIDGFPVTGSSASDDLLIVGVADFSKTFSAKAGAGGTVNLSFNIINNAAANALNDLSFIDDLDAVIPGLVATNLPLTDVCGSGSSVTGTSSISLSGASLNADSSCSFDVVLQVPASATAGTYSNITSDLLSGGLFVSDPASAALVIEPAPLFNKAFSPATINAGANSTLMFTIDNTASELSASNLSFTDNLPAGMSIADPANAGTTCSGGTISAVSGSSVFSYSGGTVSASGSCTLQVDVSAASTGSINNVSGDLTSSSGNSGTAGAALIVNSSTSVTLPTATGTGNATVEIINAEGADCNFLESAWVTSDSVSTSGPPGLEFPHGLFKFKAGPDCSGSTNFRYTLPSTTLANNSEFWKFGPTITNATPHWYRFPATFSGNTLSIVITDGDDGDADLIVNLELVDPAGPAVPTAAKPIPVFNHPMRLLLIILMAFIGFMFIKQRGVAYFK